MSQHYTAANGAFKQQIISVMETIFLYPIKDQLTGFGQFTALNIMDHLFSSYEEIDDINLEENDVKMMGPNNPTEPLACLLEHLDKGLELLRDRGRTISDVMMVSKVITLLIQTMTFNDYIR